MARKKIGHIVNFFGLKGELKVSVLTSTAEVRFAKGKKVYLTDPSGEKKAFTISSSRAKNERIYIIGLEGYDDINDIQSFIGQDIFANVRAPKGTFFYDDLVGRNVFSLNGVKDYGKVSQVTQMPAADYLIVESKYIPFQREIFIDHVDSKEKKIYLTEKGEELRK